MNVPVASVVMAMAWIAAAQAADCPRQGTLGTSRVLWIDAATTPRVGLGSFPQTLPLNDHEVVLTFDDGPWPRTTARVLAALAHECVRATFFLIGKPASEHPDLVRKIAAEGHTIGHHTWSHRSLTRIKQELKLITDRLKAAHKGIILFHDPKAQTAAMLPAFLRYLRDNDYHVVTVAPISSGADGGH